MRWRRSSPGRFLSMMYEEEVESMSTRCSELYVSVAKEEGKENEYPHSFHIYREAFSGEYFVVDEKYRDELLRNVVR
jgi:hypothetical protein